MELWGREVNEFPANMVLSNEHVNDISSTDIQKWVIYTAKVNDELTLELEYEPNRQWAWLKADTDKLSTSLLVENLDQAWNWFWSKVMYN